MMYKYINRFLAHNTQLYNDLPNWAVFLLRKCKRTKNNLTFFLLLLYINNSNILYVNNYLLVTGKHLVRLSTNP